MTGFSFCLIGVYNMCTEYMALTSRSSRILRSVIDVSTSDQKVTIINKTELMVLAIHEA